MSQSRATRSSRSRRTLISVALALLLIVPMAVHFLGRNDEHPLAPMTLQGELIDSPVEDDAVEPATETTKPRRKRYKPGSLPQRLVQSQYRMLQSGQTNLVDPSLAPTNLPPEVMLRTNEAVLQTSLVPDANGYINVGFDLLAGFDFELAADLVEAGKSQALASAKIRSQVPDGVRKLDQRKVRLRGFLLPVAMDEGRAVEFLLMRDQTLCCYGTIPKVNEWVHIRAPGKGVEPTMDTPITVTGTLRVTDQWENGYFTGLYLLHADTARFKK